MDLVYIETPVEYIRASSTLADMKKVIKDGDGRVELEAIADLCETHDVVFPVLLLWYTPLSPTTFQEAYMTIGVSGNEGEKVKRNTFLSDKPVEQSTNDTQQQWVAWCNKVDSTGELLGYLTKQGFVNGIHPSTKSLLDCIHEFFEGCNHVSSP